MITNDKPHIMTNFLTEEENEIIARFLDKTSKPSPISYNHRCALGYPDYRIASSISKDNPAVPLSNNDEDNEAIHLITEIYDRAGRALAQLYGEELLLVQASYTEYSAGPGQYLHSDMYDKEGEIRDDDISSVMKYSAVLYLSGGDGEDFTGGDLYFPAQDYRYAPEKAALICFIGDMEHTHEVQDIEAGVRKSLSMFYGVKEEVLA